MGDACFLGVDIGTSAVKVLIVDSDERPVADAEVGLATSRPAPGWSEQHPDIWWQAVRQALAEVSASTPGVLSRVAAVGLSGQMHGAVLIGDDDRPIRPAILWNDGRAAAEAIALNAAMPDLGQIAGVPAMAGFLAPKIAWLRHNEPDALASTKRILLPKDWVRLQLTGEFATDMCDAAGSLLLDEARRQWAVTVVEAVGLHLDQLPRLLEGPDISGRVTPGAAAATGLPEGIPVVAGAGDAAAAGIGIGAVADGDAFISLGTSSQLFLTTADYRPNPSVLVHAFAHALPNRWFQMAAMLNGASVMAWTAGVTGVSDLGAALEAVAERGQAISPVTFLPYLQGERTPHDDPAARGVFFGMDGGTDGLDLLQAAVEGMAFTLVDAVAALETAGPVPAALAAVGGGSRGRIVMEVVASALGRPIRRYVGGERGPAFGVARLARLAVTGETVAEVCGKPELRDVIQPNAERQAALAARLPLYRDLYRALKPLFPR
ncbi:xylulokinase [Pleomorphomonas sp. JP5]|uniref:xylulokinase n=1 Tax=Pleomorphomonas sp. JP5 TaxID=2942998 RepID=UPI002043B193|nr:xylulokinase [Pleomorphomonas sp. JP5]MCM5559609.1 xylulokinase [Pleomorphomonas sp. JP5]